MKRRLSYLNLIVFIPLLGFGGANSYAGVQLPLTLDPPVIILPTPKMPPPSPCPARQFLKCLEYIESGLSN